MPQENYNMLATDFFVTSGLSFGQGDVQFNYGGLTLMGLGYLG